VHPQKGVEWACSANSWHYRQHHLMLVRKLYPPSPWRFPPVVIRDGVQMNAWNGPMPNDRVLYAGVLEQDVTGMKVLYG
jgi:hypothetical protein